MKKIIVILLMACMMFSTVACENNNESGNDNSNVEDENVVNDLNEFEDIEGSETPNELSMEVLANADETHSEDFKYLVADGAVYITGYLGEGGIVVIPDEIDGYPVVEITKTAFRNNDNIEALKIGNNIGKIGDYAFANCIALQYVLFGDSVEIIKEYAFVGCSNMVEIRLNEGLLTLEEQATCPTIVPLIIPRSVVEIGYNGVRQPVQVYAGSYAEEYIVDYAASYGSEFVYEIIE